MTWVRLQDNFYRHPKVLAAGPAAGWLWVCGLGYANEYLTDGYVPATAIRGLMDADDPFRLAARLVDVQLWEVADGGYRIHDYAEYQPSAEAVRGQREQTAERVRAWRTRHGNGVTNASGNSVGNAVSNGAPVPGPGPGPGNPAPAVSTSPQPPPPQAEEGERRRRRKRRDGDDRERPETAAEPTRGVAHIDFHEHRTAARHDVVDIAPLAPEDARLWQLALDRLPPMTAGNLAQIVRLELLGRAPDGGLRLRAPPGSAAGRFEKYVARALADAGDAQAASAAIVEG